MDLYPIDGGELSIASYDAGMHRTAEDTVVSIRLRPDVVGRLDELASEMDRSRSELVIQAVREFVEREYASLEHISEGERDLAAGQVIAHEQVDSWLADLSEGRRRPAPRSQE